MHIKEGEGESRNCPMSFRHCLDIPELDFEAGKGVLMDKVAELVVAAQPEFALGLRRKEIRTKISRIFPGRGVLQLAP